MTAEEYTREKGGVKHVHFEPNDDIYIREDDVYRLMESYHKEASKELVEAVKLALYFCERRQMPTEHELEALSVDLRKAIENHLK